MIIITGGAGFIGSVLAWKFNALGRKDLLIVDQKAEGSPKWKNIQKRTYLDYVDSENFLDRLEKGAFKNVEAVFHMGACSDTTEMNVEFLNENNVRYTQRIAEWCLKNNAYLAYASSAATYGDGALGFSDDDALTPRLKPLNPYGQSKLDFDNWAIQKGLEKKITGFRFFNVYGPNEYHKGHMKSLAVKGFDQILAEGKLRLFKSYKKEYADGGQLRDFIYVKDVVDVMLWFYENKDIKGIFNLGTGKAQSWNDLAHALFKAMNKPANIEYIEMPDNLKNQYQYFTQADMKKFKQAGGTFRFQNLDQGISDYARLLKSPDRFL